ncbi:NACHT and WD repeat domain-containing protein [Nonomuraea purpurea]|uniref:NACHT and WD repeat domain-containing protein n=1 Tax=Nonomuraea purpurea TaxID=1849276 RepID=A0ABV8GEG9_9ACTN
MSALPEQPADGEQARPDFHAAGEAVDSCPYPGLAPFEPEQARWFFGRDRLLEELTARLEEHTQHGGPLMVVAPSGAGKSSLLRAGLMPALEDGALPGSQYWLRLLFTPTARPMAALRASLETLPGIGSERAGEAIEAGAQQCARLLHETLRDGDADSDVSGPRLVVIVDQLEELFTQCPDEPERRRFIEVITELAGPGPEAGPPVALVVCGLRSDFYPRCADYPRLRAALQDGQVPVGPMSQDELREAIQYPARDVDVDVEPELVERLLSDLGATTGDGYEAGRLPLLAHALRATWQQRHGHTLTVDGYRVTGGIQRAVATTAERVFLGLDEADQQTARALFLRLVTISDGVDDVRRRVARTDLLSAGFDSGSTAAVVDAFTHGRLLTQNQDTVEITHEALLSAWPRLREWVEADREVLITHHALADAARRWHRHGRERGDLLQGTALDQAVTYALAGPRHLTPDLLERSFLDHSIRAVRRTGRNRTLLSAALAVLLAVAAGTAIVQGRTLAERSRTITHQGDEAVAARIAGQAADHLGLVDAATAKQLAVAAASLAPDAYATRRALSTLYNQPVLYTYRPPGVDGHWEWTETDTGRVEAAARSLGHEVKIIDVDQRKVTRTITLTGTPIAESGFTRIVSVSGDGKVVAVVRQDGTVGLWDTATGRAWPVAFRVSIPYIALNETGTRLVSPEGSGKALRTKVWDTATGKPVWEHPGSLAAGDGKYLIYARGTTLQWRDLETGQRTPRQRLVLDGEPISDLSVSPDGKILAVRQRGGNSLGIIRLDDVDKSGRIGKYGPGVPVPAGVRWLTIPPDSKGRIGFSSDNRYLNVGATIWDLDETYFNQPVFQYADTNCLDFVFGPGDRTLRCVRDDVTVLSLSALRDPVQLIPEYLDTAVTSTDGMTLALRRFDYRGVEIWDPIRRTLRATLPIPKPDWGKDPGRFELSQDGRLLAYIHGNGDIDIWDVASATRKNTLRTHHKLGARTPVAFSPDGKTLAVATLTGYTTRLDLWDVRSATRRATSTGRRQATTRVVAFSQLDEPSQILFSHDGRTVISAPDQGVVDVATGKRLTAPSTELFEPLALSKNGVLADRVGMDKTLTVYDGRTLRRLARARINSRFPRWMRFSPDGDLLAIAEGSSDQIRLWHVPSRTPYGPVLTSFPTSTIKTLAFTPDGSSVLALDDEGRLRTTLIAPGQIKAALCAQFGPLSEADWKTYIPEVPYRKTC